MTRKFFLLILFSLLILSSCRKAQYWEQLDIEEQETILNDTAFNNDIKSLCKKGYKGSINIDWNYALERLCESDTENKRMVHFYIIIKLLDEIDADPAEAFPIT